MKTENLSEIEAFKALLDGHTIQGKSGLLWAPDGDLRIPGFAAHAPFSVYDEKQDERIAKAIKEHESKLHNGHSDVWGDRK